MLIQSEDAARAFVADRCSDDAFHRLMRFVLRLIDRNATQNLVSQPSLDAIWQRHIADSAQLLDHVPRGTQPWIDLGTGAGFPGLILAIMQPERTFCLIESRRLRIAWLVETIRAFDLSNCEVIGSDISRVRDLEAGVISARAFAPLGRLLVLSARFSTTSTRWVLPKGRSAAKEVAALPPSLRQMFHVEQSKTNGEAGIVVGSGQVEIVP